jgi:hypothetical protein
MEAFMSVLKIRRLIILSVLLLALAACQRQPEIAPTLRPTITPSPVPTEEATAAPMEEPTAEPTASAKLIPARLLRAN